MFEEGGRLESSPLKTVPSQRRWQIKMMTAYHCPLLYGESGSVDKSESEELRGNAPSPTSFSPPPCTSPTAPAVPLAASTTVATTYTALFSDEHFMARVEALQIASEIASIKMKRQEAALAQAGTLPR